MAGGTLEGARRAILAAYGVLPALPAPDAGGPLIRKAQRHLATWALSPVAAPIGPELAKKLGTPVTLDVLAPLQACDAGRRARASSGIVKSLDEAKDAGFDPATVSKAFAMVGWQAPQDIGRRAQRFRVPPPNAVGKRAGAVTTSTPRGRRHAAAVRQITGDGRTHLDADPIARAVADMLRREIGAAHDLCDLDGRTKPAAGRTTRALVDRWVTSPEFEAKGERTRADCRSWADRFLAMSPETGSRPGDVIALTRQHIEPTPAGRRIRIRTRKRKRIATTR
ncbi:MAG: hypothetical protein R6V44_01525 [Paracoccaceae bacterium]